MNKAKLVKLGEEVLREIDLEMESLIRTEIEKKLCLPSAASTGRTGTGTGTGSRRGSRR